jgi:hypothetical protein
VRLVDFCPESLPPERKAEWDAWSARAEAAMLKVQHSCARGEQPTFDRTIWKELKEWLFEHVFDEKCAYCEGLTSIVSVGDGEHWRPKRAVTTIDGQPVTDRNGTAHPGYFWLAYDWENLLPSCERCNRFKGKGTRFPIEGEYAFSPNDGETFTELDPRELPLLLHPFGTRDPAAHISFNSLGQPVPLSDVGDASIRVFNLERDSLNRVREKRSQRMLAVADSVFLTWFANRGSGAKQLPELMEERLHSDDDFSLARAVFLRQHIDSRLRELRNEAPVSPDPNPS